MLAEIICELWTRRGWKYFLKSEALQQKFGNHYAKSEIALHRKHTALILHVYSSKYKHNQICVNTESVAEKTE